MKTSLCRVWHTLRRQLAANYSSDRIAFFCEQNNWMLVVCAASMIVLRPEGLRHLYLPMFVCACCAGNDNVLTDEDSSFPSSPI